MYILFVAVVVVAALYLYEYRFLERNKLLTPCGEFCKGWFFCGMILPR